MKRTIALLALIVLVVVMLTGCNTPQPLPVAPTPIPTLPPATLPPPGAASTTANAQTAGVVFPSAPPSQAAGEAIYQKNCASCHGDDGKGKVDKARDFTDVAYIRAAAPVDFFQTVSGGRGTMPPFRDTLSDDQRWNVVYYLWSFSVKADLLAQGKTIFDANCVPCHGANGQGAIPQAARFTPEFVSKYPTTQFYQSVSGGKGIMPAWQDRLSADDRWAAIEYARSFAYQPLGQ